MIWFLGMFAGGFGFTIALFAVLEAMSRYQQTRAQQRTYERWKATYRATWR